MKRYIVIKTQFEGIHCWPECDTPEVIFLKHPHRHIFYVMMKWEVFHNDRDKEFITMKRLVEDYISLHFRGKNLGRMSCEDLADKLHFKFKDSCFVSVFEDDENGVEVYYD